MTRAVSLGVLVMATSLGLAATCHQPTPTLTGLEIAPRWVVVGSDLTTPTTFQLEARLWVGPVTDRRTAVKPKDYQQLKWSDDQPWLQLGSASGVRVPVSVDPGTGTGPPAQVKVEAGGLTATATVVVVPAVTTGEDVVTSGYTAGQLPGAVVVSGVPQGATSGCDVRLAAFVRRSTMGKLAAPCSAALAGWDAAVADPDHNAVFPAGGWTSGDDAVDAGAQQKSPRVLRVALRIMVGSTSPNPSVQAQLQDDALVLARLDVATTNSILEETRAGIELSVTDEKKIPVSQPVLLADCGEGDALTSQYDLPDVLNVYYVNGMYGLKGRTCAGVNARPWDVLYVGYDLHSTSSLVHELGHTLGLMLPGQGHSDMLARLDISNVMNGWDDDGEPGGRRRLSVGQVFRMNADAGSWINRAVDGGGNLVREIAAPRIPCQCGSTDPLGPCPTLATDVAAPSQAVSKTQDWDCVDLLYLKKVTYADNESPVALAAGRGWRALPGQCAPDDLPGREERHWGATYIALDNLGRPGNCPAWAAIFFRRHGPIYFDFPPGSLSSAANQITVDRAMPPAATVKLDIYFPAAEQGTVEQDAAHALGTFGEDNRAGVSLDLHQHPGDPCPTASPGELEIALCYGSGGAVEATLTPPRVITLRNRNATTVSHFIGRALGLDPLPAGQAGFPENIMHHHPTDRGRKLTLGQVFRIHTRFGASLPSCDPGPCPALGATTPP